VRVTTPHVEILYKYGLQSSIAGRNYKQNSHLPLYQAQPAGQEGPENRFAAKAARGRLADETCFHSTSWIHTGEVAGRSTTAKYLAEARNRPHG